MHRGLYLCSECGALINADINGAVNILHEYLRSLVPTDEAGVSVRVGELPTIWPEPSVNRYDWGETSPIVRVAGSAPVAEVCRQ